jgi:Flp pilus assembly protein TadG
MQNPISSLPLIKFLTRLARDRRGISAVAFAISFAVITPMALGIFDVYQSTEQRGKLQDALDAATLYAARSSAMDTAGVNAVGTKALGANLQLIKGATLTSSGFTLVPSQGDNKVVAQASVTLPGYAPLAYTHTPITVNSEVTRPGSNLEVALVLDTTGSMKGTPISDLQTAAKQLIDLVVSDTQTPYYSKVAIVPYSNSVNPGTLTDTVRGASLGKGPGAGVAGYDSITFTNASTKPPAYQVTAPVSNCVSERTGTEAFTDASYSTAKVGWVYQATGSGNDCIGATVRPLSSDKTKLKATIDTLSASGSTAGQIGLAWGWYTISPNWNAVFTGTSAPAAYGSDHLQKVVILMTDGAFNTGYCKGVIAKDSGTGSGNDYDHINCNATNGDAFTQAQTLCTNMKNLPHPVIIYTVGFNVGSSTAAQDLLSKCATDASHVYFPSTGTSLKVAFQQIAADLNKLRLSH